MYTTILSHLQHLWEDKAKHEHEVLVVLKGMVQENICPLVYEVPNHCPLFMWLKMQWCHASIVCKALLAVISTNVKESSFFW